MDTYSNRSKTIEKNRPKDQKSRYHIQLGVSIFARPNPLLYFHESWLFIDSHWRHHNYELSSQPFYIGGPSKRLIVVFILLFFFSSSSFTTNSICDYNLLSFFLFSLVVLYCSMTIPDNFTSTTRPLLNALPATEGKCLDM